MGQSVLTHLGKILVIQVVPLTHSIRHSTVEILVEPDEGNGLAEPSSAQCQHVRPVATTRIQRRLGNVGSLILSEIRETLALLLGASDTDALGSMPAARLARGQQ